MTSLSPESRRQPRRDSSTRSSSRRRPRLLRAAVTEPSITTSNASRNALANSQSSRRATDLLSRVAVISGSPPDVSSRTPMFDRVDRPSDPSSSPVNESDGFDSVMPHHCSYHHPAIPETSDPFGLTHISSPDSGRYFSFPSFDMYEGGQQDEDKESDMKSP
jgi:hypothetical protein